MQAERNRTCSKLLRRSLSYAKLLVFSLIRRFLLSFLGSVRRNYANQQAYYDAIARSSRAADSGAFIDFMLTEILATLEKHRAESPQEVPNKVPNKIHDKAADKLKVAYPGMADMTWRVYAELKKDNYASSNTIAHLLGISDRMVRKHLAALKDAGIIERFGSNKNGYWILKA